MTEGKKQFEQARNTACLSKEQISLLGWTANTTASSRYQTYRKLSSNVQDNC